MIVAWISCLCSAAAYQSLPVPGARAHRAFHQFNSHEGLQLWPAASLRGRAARRDVGLGANLNRQHDFGIDPNKVRRARSFVGSVLPPSSFKLPTRAHAHGNAG
jgi:hypothetical protein